MNNLLQKRKKYENKIRKKYDYEKVKVQMREYIDATTLPILKEFCYKIAKVPASKIEQKAETDEELAELCVELKSKKESALERGGLSGQLNPTMAIFSLKQLGWKDTMDIEQKSVNLNITIQAALDKVYGRKQIEQGTG